MRGDETREKGTVGGGVWIEREKERKSERACVLLSLSMYCYGEAGATLVCAALLLRSVIQQTALLLMTLMYTTSTYHMIPTHRITSAHVVDHAGPLYKPPNLIGQRSDIFLSNDLASLDQAPSVVIYPYKN